MEMATVLVESKRFQCFVKFKKLFLQRNIVQNLPSWSFWRVYWHDVVVKNNVRFSVLSLFPIHELLGSECICVCNTRTIMEAKCSCDFLLWPLHAYGQFTPTTPKAIHNNVACMYYTNRLMEFVEFKKRYFWAIFKLWVHLLDSIPRF